MITSNNVPRQDGEEKKLRTITTNKLELRRSEFRVREFPTVEKREANRQPLKAMLTTDMLDELARKKKRAEVAGQRKAAQVKTGRPRRKNG